MDESTEWLVSERLELLMNVATRFTFEMDTKNVICPN